VALVENLVLAIGAARLTLPAVRPPPVGARDHAGRPHFPFANPPSQRKNAL
jgi:hypothetical protein